VESRQKCEEHIGADAVDSLGAMIDYAKHHGISERTIDVLQGMQDRAAWVALYAPDAVQGFIDELAAREEQPDEDSFCIWCHHRDEREARKLVRDAGA
jgi:hypothetical protein